MADQPGSDHDRRNGVSKAKMATKAATAMPHIQPFLSAREPMRWAACRTMRRDSRLDAVEDAGDQRHVTEAQVDPRQRDQDEQRRQHEQAPATMPPQLRCISQPMWVASCCASGPGRTMQ